MEAGGGWKIAANYSMVTASMGLSMLPTITSALSYLRKLNCHTHYVVQSTKTITKTTSHPNSCVLAPRTPTRTPSIAHHPPPPITPSIQWRATQSLPSRPVPPLPPPRPVTPCTFVCSATSPLLKVCIDHKQPQKLKPPF